MRRFEVSFGFAWRTCVTCTLLWCGLATSGRGQLFLEGGGLTLVQEGPPAAMAGDEVPDNLALSGTPFGTGELGPALGLAYHFIDNLNDGAYGNAYSWIGLDTGEFFDFFAGIDLGATPVDNLQSIAFGRSNVLAGDVCAGVCMDRHLGLYTLQYTQFPRPSTNLDLDSSNDPTSGWVDIGTLDYVGSEGFGTNFNQTWQRHRYNFDPVSATGMRLIVPNADTAIDEIELYTTAGEVVDPPPAPDPIEISVSAPFSITWDGNNGDFGQDFVPDNFALAESGATPFTSSDLGPQLGIAYHVVENVNDGIYGNGNSWIGGDDNPYAPIQFAGVSLAEAVSVSSVAWGRDNQGQFGDRSLGEYSLQFTLVPDPDADTPDTGDPVTGWQTIGSVRYSVATAEFTPQLRHEFEISRDGSPILATGVRLLVPGTGLGAGTAIDELEVYGIIGPVGEPCDLNGDGVCDVMDIDELTAVVVAGTDDPRYDVDRNGEVNQEDRRIWVEELMNTWFGDADLNGTFDSSDFVAVFQAGKYENPDAQDVSWGEGDWDGNQIFDSSDFVQAFQSGGYEVGPRGAVAAVPEPASGLLLLGILPMLAGLRRLRVSK